MGVPQGVPVSLYICGDIEKRQQAHRPTSLIVRIGVFDEKRDAGYNSEWRHRLGGGGDNVKSRL